MPGQILSVHHEESLELLGQLVFQLDGQPPNRVVVDYSDQISSNRAYDQVIYSLFNIQSSSESIDLPQDPLDPIAAVIIEQYNKEFKEERKSLPARNGDKEDDSEEEESGLDEDEDRDRDEEEIEEFSSDSNSGKDKEDSDEGISGSLKTVNYPPLVESARQNINKAGQLVIYVVSKFLDQTKKENVENVKNTQSKGKKSKLDGPETAIIEKPPNDCRFTVTNDANLGQPTICHEPAPTTWSLILTSLSLSWDQLLRTYLSAQSLRLPAPLSHSAVAAL
ncbi:hypothetical protein GG344DRAFT_69763 [Lentinula edodes]|nr:hypothetical protein GG344DRAFT_69763 [Lentinula edodes]